MSAQSSTISRLRVENFLSLRDVDISFAPLNVLVGPNGAGKSNILKAFQFLGDVARLDLLPAIEDFGGIDDLLYRGADRKSEKITISLTGILTRHASQRAPDEYKLSFKLGGFSKANPARRLVEREEEIVVKRTAGPGRRITISGDTVRFENVGGQTRSRGENNTLAVQRSSAGLATLRRLSERYGAAQVEEWAQVFESLRLIDIDVERVRRPSKIFSPEKLRPDASNLASFLKWMRDEHPDSFESVCQDVGFVLPGFRRFEFVTVGGSDEAIRLDLKEAGLSGSTPLGRASFGTIRSIALFAMLHDPKPPKLTCLEEIDHGLHPYALDRLVDRLRQASASTQIILATHSPALVNRLEFEELVVVERDDETGATRVVTQDRQAVEELRRETGYQLGELWFSGSLGSGLNQHQKATTAARATAEA